MELLPFIRAYWSSPKIVKQEVTIPVFKQLTLDAMAKVQQDACADPECSPEERALAEACAEALRTLQDTAQSLLAALHLVCKHLTFWQKKSEDVPRKKLQTMVLERGPWQFLVSMSYVASSLLRPASKSLPLTDLATASITERSSLLATLKNRLASALGEVYLSANKLEEAISQRRWREALPELLASAHSALRQLEGSYGLPKAGYGGKEDPDCSWTLSLTLQQQQKLDGPAEEGKLKRDVPALQSRIESATALINDDVQRIQQWLTVLMVHYRRPHKAARLWVQYTAGGVGLAIVSSWLIRHSRLAGSDDLEIWAQQGKDAAMTFLRDHAITPQYCC